MHYYKRNLGDYAKKAGRLSMLQHGAYNLLIDACYDREQFPTRDEAIDWAWASSPDEIAAVEFVLSRFFDLQDDGRYVQKRIEEELAAYSELKDKQAKNGKKGGRPRKPTGLDKKPTGFSEKPNPNPDKATGAEKKPKKSLTTNQEPLTNNQEPIKPLSAEADLVTRIFDYWVSVMGKPQGQTKLTPKRRKAVKARLTDGYTLEQITTAIDHCRCDPWSMGANDRNTPFNDLELICRTGEKLESFIEKIPAANRKAQDFSAIAREAEEFHL